jgi:hypothetical protein
MGKRLERDTGRTGRKRGVLPLADQQRLGLMATEALIALDGYSVLENGILPGNLETLEQAMQMMGFDRPETPAEIVARGGKVPEPSSKSEQRPSTVMPFNGSRRRSATTLQAPGSELPLGLRPVTLRRASPR